MQFPVRSQVIKVLGDGGTCTVLEARKKDTGQLFAIKAPGR